MRRRTDTNIIFSMKHRLRDALRGLAVGLCVGAGASPHGGEGLYAVAGVPLSLDDTPVVLYRVEGGGLAKVRTVATLRQNPHVVKSYPEKGFVFVVSDGAFKGSFLVDILDLGDMSRERSVDFDMCDGCIFSKARLLERNGHLVFYIRAGGDGPEGEHVSYYLGVDLHGGDFVRDIGRADVTYLHHAGGQSGGVDGSDYMGGIYVRERNPDQPYVLRHSDTFDLRWQLPDWFSKPEGAHMQQVANNDHARVVSVGGGPEGTSQWLVFDKSAGRWSGVPTSTYPFGGDDRLVGRWLVQEEIRDGFDGAAWDDAPGRPDPESVPFWPAENSRLGKELVWSAQWRASIRDRTPTGRLRFYDTQTGNVAVHDTAHLDSETLMIDESDAVYFRVGDELRRADLGDGRLANEETVAKAPELLAVHWLFRGVD